MSLFTAKSAANAMSVVLLIYTYFEKNVVAVQSNKRQAKTEMNAGFMPVINKSDLIVPIELITQCEHSHVLADILHPIRFITSLI